MRQMVRRTSPIRPYPAQRKDHLWNSRPRGKWRYGLPKWTMGEEVVQQHLDTAHPVADRT